MSPKMNIKRIYLQSVMIKASHLQAQGYTRRQALRKAWQWMKAKPFNNNQTVLL